MKKLHPINLQHTFSITDETGIIQHAKFSIPNRKEGYTTDDNSRALILCKRHHDLTKSKETLNLAEIYLSFLHYMQNSNGTFHNFLSYDRRFLDVVGSEDNFGRALWACGNIINSCFRKDQRLISKELFDKAFPNIQNLTSPRAKAFTIMGLIQYHFAYPGDQNIVQVMEKLCIQLIDLFRKNCSKEWKWFEQYLTYCNGRLVQALFEACNCLGNKTDENLIVALESFKFLLDIQMLNDVFVPIGNDGWYIKGGKRALYDQQSIEASCMTEAALAAFQASGNNDFLISAGKIFDWYMKRNTQELTVYDPKTGGCYDGITPHGLNLNQGAEATITYNLVRLKLDLINGYR